MSSTIPSHIGSRLGMAAPEESSASGSGTDVEENDHSVKEALQSSSHSEETHGLEKRGIGVPEKPNVKKRKARNVRKRKPSSQPLVEPPKKIIEDSEVLGKKDKFQEKIAQQKEQISHKEIQGQMPKKKKTSAPAKAKAKPAQKVARVEKPKQTKRKDEKTDKTEAQKFVEKLSSDTQSFLEKLRQERIQRSKEVDEMKKKIRSELSQNQSQRRSQQQSLENELDQSREERLSELSTIKKEVKEILKK